MRKVLMLGMALGIMCLSSVVSAEYVRGHYRSNGTYVQGYHRSSANGTKMDNYSTRGNYNPYTGAKGTRSPY